MAGLLRALAGTTATVVAVSAFAVPTSRAQDPAQRSVLRSVKGSVQRSALDDSPDLIDRIRRIPIVDRVTEVRRSPSGTRFFRIEAAVPVDHAEPDGPTFDLRVNLLHRGFARPTVVETSGYRLWDEPYRSEVTRLVDGNQLDIEHRFFSPSLPEDPDWATQLTIRQVADDHHLVIQAFRHLYDGRWLSTGDSKGGMAATYHRRWYPDDVTATVAYVAPNDVVDDEDAYGSFLARVGGPRLADCRERLVALQRRVLTDRGWFRHRLGTWSEDNRLTWSYVGSLDRGLEASVIDFSFAFWQYWGDRACASVPVARRLTNPEVWRYLGLVNPWSNLSDQRRFYSLPYHYQAAAQIGGPKPYEAPLRDLLVYPGEDTPSRILPPGLEPAAFDTGAMPDIDRWVRTSARRMLYVNGEHDPWSAEPFRCGATGPERSCRSVVAPRATHGALIEDLPRAARQRAVRDIRAWAGLGGHARAQGHRVVRRLTELDRRYLSFVRAGRRR